MDVMHKKIGFFILWFLFSLLKTITVFGQGDCECTNCPQSMPDGWSGDVLLTIQNASNNDLSNPDQGICGMHLEIDHTYIGDYIIELVSPSGQSIKLMGPVGLHGETDLTSWKVDFLQCSDPNAMPDPGFSAFWSNAQPWGTGNSYTGSYYPYEGCLEDFNSGPVNGTWIVRITDGQEFDVGTLINFTIDFCDPEGITCSTNPCGLYVDLEYPSVYCAGKENVVIDGSNSISGFGITYSWETADGHFVNGTDLTQTIVEVDAPGTYTLTIKGQNGCVESKSALIQLLGIKPDIVLADVSDLTCSDTVVVLDASGSTANTFIQWYDGANNGSGNNLLGSEKTQEVTEPGIYTLQVVNTTNGCFSEETIEVMEVVDYPDLEIPTPDTLNCLKTSVPLNPVSSTYSNTDVVEWEGPNGFTAGTLVTNALDSGVYYITLTNDLGCKTIDTVEVLKDTAVPQDISTGTSIIHCNTPTVTISASSSTNGVSYEWSGPNGYVSTAQNPNDISEPGDYTVVVTGENGCSTSETVTVVTDAVKPDLTVGFADENTIDCNVTSLDIETQVSGTGITYNWTSLTGVFSASTPNVTVNEPGFYQVTITDGNGCSNVKSIEVFSDLDTPKDVVTTATEITCKDNATIDVTSSTPNVTFHWEGPMGLVSDQASFTSAAAGNYMVTVTGANGCTSTDNIMVTEDKTTPDASAVGGIITCAAGSVSLGGSSSDPNVTYMWTGPNNYVSNEQNPVVGSEGTYTLVTTAENGCESSPAVAVVNNDNGVPDISATTSGGILTLDCNHPDITLMGNSTSSDVTFEWTGPNLSTTQTTATVMDPGTYTFKVSAMNGCKSQTDIVITDDFTPPENIDFEKLDIDCNHPVVDIKATSSTENVTYEWAGNGITSNINPLQVDAGGEYMVTVTGENGCKFMTSVNIAEDKTLPTVNVGDNKKIDCINETAVIGTTNTSTGADIEYQWLNAQNVVVGQDITLEVNAQNDYILIVTNTTNGCVNQDTVQVEVDKTLPSSVEINPASLVLDCDVTDIATNTSFSDVSNPSYQWTGPNGDLGTSKDIMMSDSGRYSFVVTNLDNGCSAMKSVDIDLDRDAPDVQANNGKIPCDPGTFELKAFSTTNGVTFLWKSPSGTQENTATWTISEAGDYTLIATGPNACTTEVTVVVEPDKGVPELALSPIEKLTCTRTTVDLDASASVLSGDGMIQFIWTDIDDNPLGNDAVLEVTEPGDYKLTEINSSNKCEVAKTVTVEQDTIAPTADAGEDQLFSCKDTEKTLSADNSKPASITSTLSYAWSKNNVDLGNTKDISVTEDGVFTLKVTDSENGCTDSDMVTITPDINKPTPAVDISGILTCKDLTVELNAENSKVSPASTGNLVFEWSNNTIGVVSGENLEVSIPGQYVLTLKDDENGCTKDTTVMVEQNIEKPTVVATALNEITCKVAEAEISTAGSKSSNVTYQWTSKNNDTVTDADMEIAKVNTPGRYVLVVTDNENGCSETKEVTVLEDKDLPKVDPTVDGEIDCIKTEVTLSIGDSEKGANIEYVWKGPNMSSTDTEVMVSDAGVYTLKITNNENDCFDSDSVLVKKLPEITDLSDLSTNQNCFAPNSGVIEFVETEGGTPPYKYSIDGGATFTDYPIFDELLPGNYDIVVQGSKGCTFTKQIEIEAYIQPELDLGEDVSVVLGDAVSINPIFQNITSDTIIWNLDSLSGFNPTFYPKESTFIEATVYDEAGCQATDRLSVFVKKVRPVYVPSAFSPNGDGINDVFTVFTGNSRAVESILSLEVFDRWGTRLFGNYNFKSDDITQGWDGLYKGKEIRAGVYVYFLEVKFLDGTTELYKGDVSVLR